MRRRLVVVVLAVSSSAALLAGVAHARPPSSAFARGQLLRALSHTSGGAAGELRRATNRSLWLNPKEVVAPAYGENVFRESVAALTELQGAPRGVATSALIVRALHAVASEAVTQARAGNQKLLAAARQDLASAGRLSGSGQYASAGQAAAQAWIMAFRALTGLVSRKVTHVPDSAVVAAATEALGSKTISLAGPSIQSKLPPLTEGGKPEFFFAGAEGCPFCAVERWGMIVALSRFGTFSNLHLIQSETLDFPAVRTFTFYGARYRSAYVAFVPVEVVSNVRRGAGYVHLQHLTKAQKTLVHRFDPPAETPFIDIANRFTSFGSTAPPELLGGMTWTAIADSLTNPSSLAAQAVGGEAEVLTAETCVATGGKPARVCSDPLVQQYEAALPLLDGMGGGCLLGQVGAIGDGVRSQPPRAGEARCHTK
jgi:hypothetical protein